MQSKVRGFVQWANERLEWRRDPPSAAAASARRVDEAFRTTAVPIYGMPASVECERSITYGPEVPMGPVPVGGEHIVRFVTAPGVFVHPFRSNPYTDSGVFVHLGSRGLAVLT